MNRPFLWTLLLIWARPLLAQNVFRPPSENLQKDQWEVTFQAKRFISDIRYDDEGQGSEFSESESFSETNLLSGLTYALNSSLQTNLALNFRQNQSTQDIRGTPHSNTKSGAQAVIGGMQWQLLRGGSGSIALDFSVLKTFYKNKKYSRTETVPQNELILGDDGFGYKAGLGFSLKPSSTFFMNAKVSYADPPNNLSNEIGANANVQWARKHWGLILGTEAIFSLYNDQYSDAPAAKPRMAQGMTSLYNSVNRESITPYIQLSFFGHTFGLDLFFGRTLSGISTDGGYDARLALTFQNQGYDYPVPVNPSEKAPPPSPLAIKGKIISVLTEENKIEVSQGSKEGVRKGMIVYVQDKQSNDLRNTLAQGEVIEVKDKVSIIQLNSAKADGKSYEELVPDLTVIFFDHDFLKD